MNTLSSPKPAKASLFAPFNASLSIFLSFTILMPLPPPPAAAFIRRGRPNLFIFLTFSDMGRVGTPAFSANSFAFNLSPIADITFGLGPTHIIFSLRTFLANLAFSERKP